MIESGFRFFLLAHLVLAAGYLFFAISLRILERHRAATQRQRLRFAQLAFLMALAAPLAASLVPVRPLPRIERTLRAPFAELSGKLAPAATAREPEEPTVRREAPRRAFGESGPLPSRWILFGLMLATLLRVAWLGRERLRLRHVLRDSHSFRSVGSVRIALSETIDVPFAARFGGTKWIILPCALAARWRDLRIALKHEAQHHRQADPAWAMALELVGSLFVLNPAMRAWKRSIAELQEFSCDEALLGRRRVRAREYASCLFRVAEAALGGHAVPAGTAGMAQIAGNPEKNRSFLLRRIEMLMNPQPQRRSRAVVWLGTGLALSTFTVAYATKIASHFSDDTIRPGIAVVDPDVQKITDAAVRATVKKFDAQAAFAVVADPTTGRVLAVSNVDKRPNPLKGQWALSFRIEPASVIKTLLVTAAFDAKLSTPDETLNCENGSYTLGGKLYQDWKEFEKLTTTETVVSSSNVCGIKIAEKLGGVRLLETLKSYGFGSEGTASDFPAARPGQLPDPAQFSPADLLATLATGNSGVWITPLEMISAYSAIANGGYVLKPQEATAAAHSRKVVRRAFSEETAAAARKILVQVIEKGTGANAKSTHYRFAGKTATTWHPGFGDPAKLGGVANVAGFIGLAPAESARLVIYVSVFEPKPSAHGATQAAPLFKEIAEKVLAHWKFEADPK